MLKNLTLNEFLIQLTKDLEKRFKVVKIQENYLYVENAPTNVSLPIHSIYKEYEETKSYEDTLNTYLDIIEKILNQYLFKIDYHNIFPILKQEGYEENQTNFTFYKEHLFEDIYKYYVSDEGEVFRFLLESDEFDKKTLEKHSLTNLNQIDNSLVKISEFFPIYTLEHTSDYAPSFLFHEGIKKELNKLFGNDFLVCIPSSTNLFVASYDKSYFSIFQSFIAADKDPNKVSNVVYRCKNGVYEIVYPVSKRENYSSFKILT